MTVRLYMSGAVEQHKKPESWRNGILRMYEGIDWVSPTEFGFNDKTDESVVVERCLNEISECDGVLLAYEEEVPTWGTPIEQYFAYKNDIPVAVWTATEFGNLPKFLIDHADYINVDVHECVKYFIAKDPRVI